MTAQYYIRSRGRVQGPFTADKLRELAQHGRFARHFEVSTDGTIWSLASSFPGLFPKPTERKVRAAPAQQSAVTAQAPVLADQELELDALGDDTGAIEEWHYIRNGSSQGPISFSELCRLAAAGKISPQDYVWSEGMAGWSPASTVPRLFPLQGAIAQASPQFVTVMPTVTQTSSTAIASLVLGLLGVTVLPFLGSVLAIVFGHMASKEIDRSQGTISGRGMALVGLILGYLVVGSVLVACAIFFVFMMIGIMVAANH